MSSSSSTGQIDSKRFVYTMDFNEEEKHSDTSSIKSGQYKGRESSADETEFEFGTDDEEDIFLDAQEELI